MTSPFERFDNDDVRALIAEYPLAWLIARGADGGDGSLLPMVGVHEAAGRLIEVIGHFARSNPLHAALAADPRATLMFRGPEGYVSPEHAGRRDWAPTWNYAQLTVHGEIALEPMRTGEALDILIQAVEHDRAKPWQADELGSRYARLLDQIVGFRLRVHAVRGKFKLGQDEEHETLRAILIRGCDGGCAGSIGRDFEPVKPLAAPSPPPIRCRPGYPAFIASNGRLGDPRQRLSRLDGQGDEEIPRVPGLGDQAPLDVQDPAPRSCHTDSARPRSPRGRSPRKRRW